MCQMFWQKQDKIPNLALLLFLRFVGFRFGCFSKKNNNFSRNPAVNVPS